MSDKDLQFIERALAHPWMFWAYFWKWPRIVRQACAEYDLLAKERDTAKAAYERSERANKLVRDWIHVTHRLSTTPEAIRAIFAAGKRLSLLLAFFIATNAFGQAPPYLRNQWTTNANPIAVKVISTNGVQAATNVWALDFTNTASVTVNVVSNAGKVVFSFIGATNSGGSGSIVGATNLGLEMSGAQGLFMQTNNQLIELRSLVPGTQITFSTNATNIAINSTAAEISDLVWTNDGLFTWLAGTGSPYTFPGPPFLIRSDGSVFYGSNVIDAIGGTNFGVSKTPLYAQYFVASNDLTALKRATLTVSVADGVDYNYFSELQFTANGDKDAPLSTFTVEAQGTNAYTDSTVQLIADPQRLTTMGSRILLREEGDDRVVLSPNPVDNSSAIAFLFRTSKQLTNTGAKLFSLQNTNLEKVHVKYNGAIYSATLTPSTVLQANSSTNIASIPNATGALTNNGSGGLGWYDLSSLGGGGATNAIGSIFTNNVLAGGPGLTELEFTNTATVTWAATTNAGRVTMSATSAGGGSGIATNAGTGWNTTIVGTLTNTGTIGQIAPLQQWNNSNSTQSAYMQSNAVLVLQSNIVGVLFGPGASAGNVGLKGSAGSLVARKGDDSAYATFDALTLNTYSSPNMIIGRGSAPQNLVANNLGIFSWLTAGVTELYNDTGTRANTNRLWGSRTNSTTGWWQENGYSDTFSWHFIRTMSGTSLPKPLAFGIGTNWAFRIITNNFDTAGGAISINNTVDTTATTGMTINKSTGRVRLSAGNQTYLVTNNLATANSIVTATPNSDDATAKSVIAVPTAGLITLKCNAATTANTDISFFISAP